MWSVFEVVVRTLVGGLLIAGGCAKLASSSSWRQRWLASYELVPTVLVRPASWGVPAGELILGAALLAGAFDGAAAAGAATMLSAMTAAVVWALIRGLRISCGCFGPLGELISWRIVVRNLLLITALVALAVHGVTAPAIAGFSRGIQVLVIMTLAAAALLFSRCRSHSLPHRRHERGLDESDGASDAFDVVPAER